MQLSARRFFGAATVGALCLLPSVGVAKPNSPFPSVGRPLAGRGVLIGAIGSGATPRALTHFSLDGGAHSSVDHPIRDIGIDLVDNRLMRAWFTKDGKRGLAADGTWRELGKSKNAKFFHTTQFCEQEVCSLRASFTGNKVPLIAGFSFHDLTGPNKVERLAIYPETRGNTISYKARYKVPERTQYVVDLFIVVIEPDIVDGTYNAAANSRDGESFARVPLKWKKTKMLALQGFDVRFRNGAHDVGKFAITGLAGTNAQMRVELRDRNGDDPTWAKLWWADLKAPGMKATPIDKPIPRHQPNGPVPQLDPKVNPGPAQGKGTSKGKSKGNRFPSNKAPRKLPKARPAFPK